MKFTPYSYSRIAVYQQCPKKFKYSYIDKLPRNPQDQTALIKGGCIHHILEHYPEKSSHKRQPDYQYIVDKFLETPLGKELMQLQSKRETNIGLTKELQECSYSDKEALFRGSVDYFTIKEETEYQEMEINDLSEIPDGWELDTILES